MHFQALYMMREPTLKTRYARFRLKWGPCRGAVSTCSCLGTDARNPIIENSSQELQIKPVLISRSGPTGGEPKSLHGGER